MAPLGNTGIILPNVPLAMAFSVLDHATEFENLERLAMAAYPLTAEKDATL